MTDTWIKLPHTMGYVDEEGDRVHVELKLLTPMVNIVPTHKNLASNFHLKNLGLDRFLIVDVDLLQ